MKKIRVLLLVFTFLLSLASCGKLVIGGGGILSTNKDIYQAFINLSTPASGVPVIGVITAGSTWSIAQSTATDIINILKVRYKLTNVSWLPFHINNGKSCSDLTLANKIKGMTGVFFNGGDTTPLLQCFFPKAQTSAALGIMQQMFNSNQLAVFGSSAGSLVLQSGPVLFMKDSWSTLVSGSTYDKNGGFKFFSNGIFDVHVNTRGRQGRLIRTIFDLKSQWGNFGYGVSEDTAMVVTNNGFQVVGTAGVYVFDVSVATQGSRNTNDNGRYGLKNVKLAYLTPGDSYNMTTNKITYAKTKVKLFGANQAKTKANTTNDIFGSNVFTTITNSLFLSNVSTSTFGYTNYTNPQYIVNFRKLIGGYSMYATSPTNSSLQWISFQTCYMDLYCYANC